MNRFVILLYGIFCYAVGMAGLVFFILFVGGWTFMPVHVDSGEPGSLPTALLINVGLMLMIGVQHSGMARPGFKRILTKVVPPPAERSTYVLVSGIVFGLICLGWQPLDGTLWKVESPLVKNLLTGMYVAGWTLTVASSFVINHFELFGLQQVYDHFTGKPKSKPTFKEHSLYRIVRHPLQLGVLIGLWFTPHMSMTHLMLSAAFTVYIFIGLHFEEKDLVATLGQDYEQYQKRVPMVLPIPKFNRAEE